MSQLFARAQGTIEYVVLLAVIVVIGLVVVVLASGFSDSAPGVVKSKSDLFWSSQDVGVIDSAADSNGDAVFKFKNSEFENVTVTGINVDGVDLNFDSASISGGDDRTIIVSDLSGCVGGSRTYSVKITYKDKYGIQHTVGPSEFVVNCTPDVPGCVDSDGDHYYLDLSGCSGESSFLGHGDCDDGNASVWQLLSGYKDFDSDGYYEGVLQQVCSGAALPGGYISSGISGDCNDSDFDINPGVDEVCGNEVDDDCDGDIDCDDSDCDRSPACPSYVYLANCTDGLRAYIFDGSGFTDVGHIDDGYGCAVGVWGDDTYVYLASSTEGPIIGLQAYIFDGSSFANVGHTDEVEFGAMNVWGDGTYIYLANYTDGLRAYIFDGSGFTDVNHIDDGDYAYGVWGDGDYVYLANGSGGLRAYTFNGSSFANVGHIDGGGYASGVWGDGTYIYSANYSDGLRAYTFNGSSFTNVGNIDDGGLASGVWGDGTYIYLANGVDGLRAYTFNGSSFANVGHIDDGDHAEDVWGDGDYVYLANGSGGLRAYIFDGSGFTDVNHIDDGDYAEDVWGEAQSG